MFRDRRRHKFQKVLTSVQNTGHILINEGFNSIDLDVNYRKINVWDTNILRECSHRGEDVVPQILLATSIITDQTFVSGASDFESIHQILDHIVKYHKISAVIGLGINSYKDSNVEINNLPSSQRFFLDYLLKEQSLIGCRGLETLDFLIAYGFPRSNLFLTSCPSTQLIQNTLREIPNNLSRISVNGALINRLDLLESKVTSETMILAIPQTMDSLSNMERISKFDKRVEIFIPNSYRDWKAKLRKWDTELSLGTRFHGNIAAMSLGIPTLFMGGDIRTRELSQLTGLSFSDDLVEIETAMEIFKQTSQLDNLERIRKSRSQIIEMLGSIESIS
jgi:hypothetical protein